MDITFNEDGDHLILELTKYNMTTFDAIRELSNVLHISRKRFGYAGNKDKKAITTQHISIQGVDEEDLEHAFVPDIELEIQGRNGPIHLGKHTANRFQVTVRDINLPADTVRKQLDKIWNQLDGIMPNYFGRQRFGATRPITHVVGREILKGNYEDAVWIYIAKPFDSEPDNLQKVREDLWDSRDPERAAERFPNQYRYEKVMLYHLASKEDDYLGALKRLPEGLQNLFIHAYQSYLFNKVLSDLIEDGFRDEDFELPLIGYKTQVREDTADETLVEYMEEDGVEQSDFKLTDWPELATEGEYRDCFIPVTDFSVDDVDEDELNIQKHAAQLSFHLPKGAYATSFLREFMKTR
jgi:tRNA pseudouridine13 synthase